MKITKQKLSTLDRSYAASHIYLNDELQLIVASEAYVDEGRPCYMYGGDNFKNPIQLWENSGGCMGILQIPGSKDEILYVEDFYLKESPSRSKLVYSKYENNTWVKKDVLKIPYLHRFTIATVDNKNYVIFATIADKKQHKEDWSNPGSIYAFEIPENRDFEKIKVEKLKTDLFRNHGFYHDVRKNHNEIYFGSDQGIDKLYLKGEIKDWKFERIFEKPVGEIAVGDLNNDGYDEIITIEPFHGDKICIYDTKNKKLEKVYEYENKIDFAHALIFTTFRGVNTFVCGVRRLDSELFYIQYIDGKYVSTVIEKGIGPANLDFVNLDDKDIIISANHSQNEAAIYIVEN